MADAILSPSFSPIGGLLARNWWLLLLRGIAAILFAIAAFAWPGLALVTLVLLYGAYALVDGVMALGAAIRGGGMKDRWWLTLVGLLSVAAGVIAFAWPGLTGVTLVLLIGAWSIVRGVVEIVGGLALRKEIQNEWMLILGGVVSVLFGAALIAAPGAGALALIWLIAGWAFVFGVVMIALAFRLRRLAH